MTLAAAQANTGDTAWLLAATAGLKHAGMAGLGPDSVQGTVPTLLFATFHLTFAIITAALISDAIADRAKFGAVVLAARTSFSLRRGGRFYLAAGALWLVAQFPAPLWCVSAA